MLIISIHCIGIQYRKMVQYLHKSMHTYICIIYIYTFIIDQFIKVIWKQELSWQLSYQWNGHIWWWAVCSIYVRGCPSCWPKDFFICKNKLECPLLGFSKASFQSYDIFASRLLYMFIILLIRDWERREAQCFFHDLVLPLYSWWSLRMVYCDLS